MKRYFGNILGVVLAASLVGCGGGSSTPMKDMATSGGQDMSMMGGADLTLNGAPTGAPCAQDSDCAAGLGPNQKGLCILMTGQAPMTLTWPMGYCTSQCRTSRTDMTSGINADCPGGTGTCYGTGTTGECRTLCATGSSSADCRTGYSCFVNDNFGNLSCFPTSLSQCDPAKMGSCPKNDAAMNQTCVNVGDGTVGECLRGCDPFMPGTSNGCDPNDPNGNTACHASDQTGEGFCDSVQQGAAQGSTCANFYEACPDGMGCNGAKVCQPYCRDTSGGMTAVPCPMFMNKAGTCTKFPGMTNLTTGTIGVCTY